MITFVAKLKAGQQVNWHILQHKARQTFGVRFIDANETDYGATATLYLEDEPLDVSQDDSAVQKKWEQLVQVHDPKELTDEQKRVQNLNQARERLVALDRSKIDPVLADIITVLMER